MAVALLAAGCTTVLPPERVAVDVPAAYGETAGAPATADGIAWKPAQPAEQRDRGAWWQVFGDPALTALVTEAQENSPSLAIALARVRESRAAAGVVDASRGLRVDAGIGPTRQGDAAGTATQWRAQLGAAYEVDLFGRLSEASRAATLGVEAQEAASRSVLLALQADVAQHYFALRALDAEADVLARSIGLRQDALRLARHRFASGDTSELDVAQADTELAVTRAEEERIRRVRAQTLHALAVLLGKAPSQFTFAPAPLQSFRIDIPVGLPSELLERRPDIAQAQRQLAAASARIGVAKTAFYPSLTLTAGAGFASSTFGNLFQMSSRSWILGPLVGTMLNVPLLDGGRNRANLEGAQAAYDGLVANYRQQVLNGFREVEDSLSTLATLDRQLKHEADAVAAAGRAARLADTRYRNGSASYLEVIDAQRAILSAQRSQAQSEGLRAAATVGLIRALGGGWSSDIAGIAQSDSLAGLAKKP
jgi:multidrug efflux system outer membrane protein